MQYGCQGSLRKLIVFATREKIIENTLFFILFVKEDNLMLKKTNTILYIIM